MENTKNLKKGCTKIIGVNRMIENLLTHQVPLVHAVGPDHSAYLVANSITGKNKATDLPRMTLYRYTREHGRAQGPLRQYPTIFTPDNGRMYVHFVIDKKECGIVVRGDDIRLNYGGSIGIPLRALRPKAPTIDETVAKILQRIDPAVHAVDPNERAYLVIRLTPAEGTMYYYSPLHGHRRAPLREVPTTIYDSDITRYDFELDGTKGSIVKYDDKLHLNLGSELAIPLAPIQPLRTRA